MRRIMMAAALAVTVPLACDAQGRAAPAPPGSAAAPAGDGAVSAVTLGGRLTVLSGLNYPHGVAIKDGWLYVANIDHLVRTRLASDGSATGALDTLARYTGGGGHRTRTVIVGPDGGLYVSIGSSCNVCVEQ